MRLLGCSCRGASARTKRECASRQFLYFPRYCLCVWVVLPGWILGVLFFRPLARCMRFWRCYYGKCGIVMPPLIPTETDFAHFCAQAPVCQVKKFIILRILLKYLPKKYYLLLYRCTPKPEHRKRTNGWWIGTIHTKHHGINVFPGPSILEGLTVIFKLSQK